MVEEAGPLPERAGWTGTQIAVLAILLVVTNGVTGSVIFFAIPTGPAALTVYHPWAGSERDLFLPVIDDFTDRTGIQVTDRTFRQEDLQPILPSQFAAQRTPADVIFMPGGFITDFGQDGHAMDVSRFINEADFIPTMLDPVKVGEVFYGAAFTAKVWGLWYRDSVFTTNGWDKNPGTFAEFQTMLGDIMADGTVPIVSGNGVGWPLTGVVEAFIATYGGAQMHKDLISGAKAFTDADVKAIFTDYLVPLLQAGYFDTAVEWTQGVQDLSDANNALYMMGSWLPTMSQTEDQDDMRTMNLPGGVTLADQGVQMSADFFFIPTYTTKPAEAQAFLEYLISPEGQEKQIEQGGHFATNLNADDSVAPPTFSGDLIAGKQPLADLDDSLAGDFQSTFWSQLQLLWADPFADLDTILQAIEAAR